MIDCFTYLWRFLQSIGWIVIVAFCVGIVYLCMFPLSNALAILIIGNTYCPNWVWGVCGVRTFSSNYTLVQEVSTVSGLVGFSLSFGIIVSLAMIGIAPMLFTTSWENRRKFLSTYTRYFVLVAWIICMIPVALKTGPMFGTRFVPICKNYTDYAPFVIGDWYYDVGDGDDGGSTRKKIDIASCEKFQSFGYGKGAFYNPSLPGDIDGCTRCTNIGFWSVYLTSIIVPVLLYLFIMGLIICIVKCREYQTRNVIPAPYRFSIVNNEFEE